MIRLECCAMAAVGLVGAAGSHKGHGSYSAELTGRGWRYRSSNTWSSIDEAPHGFGSLRIATTAQVVPLLSRLKPAIARTVFRVPVLICASPDIAVCVQALAHGAVQAGDRQRTDELCGITGFSRPPAACSPFPGH